MRILMVLYTPVGKGTYWRTRPLARELTRRGHDVTLLATPRKRTASFQVSKTRDGTRLVTSPDLLGGPFRYGWDPLNVLSRLLWSPPDKVDVIHGFESRPTVSLPALLWSRRYGAPLVLDWCDWFGRGGSVEERSNAFLRTALRPFETYFETAFRAKVDGATVINSVLERRALGLGVLPERLLRLPNGANTDEIRPLPCDKARARLGMDPDERVIGYLGDLFPRDAELLVAAFEALVRIRSDTRLLMMGDCGIDVRSLVSDPNRVIRTGRVDYAELPWYLAACDICWLALHDSLANRGRSPMKLSDYMAAGRPVVATDVGDVGGFVREGAFGVVSVPEPEVLADQTAKLLDDRPLLDRLGRQARTVAEQRCAWSGLAAQLEAHYLRLIARRQSGYD